jgi:putative SOS response-associated peptidase YedK
MCGRYSLFVPPDDLAARFGVDTSVYEPRYNAAPGQSLPVITDEDADTLQALEWGFVPPWADEKTDGGHINARAETLTETPSFRDAFEQESDGELAAGRCLVPADGFYEWVETDGGKQPYRVTRTDDEPFAMAGLWAQWKPPTTQTGLDAFASGAGNATDTDVVETFAIVTTEPNDLVADLHHRMAVVLDENEERRWLGDSTADVQELLAPYPSTEMRAYPVSTAVNDPSNDSPALVEPVGNGGETSRGR